MKTSRGVIGLVHSLVAVSFATAAGGCWSQGYVSPRVVYVRPEALVSAHPALSIRRPSRVQSRTEHMGLGTPTVHTPDRVQPFSAPAAPRRQPPSEDFDVASRYERLKEQLLRRVAREEARQARLDEALLTAERSEAVHALEKCSEVEWERRHKEAARQLRELELRLIGLRSQLRVLSPGWRDDVEAEIERTVQAQQSVTTELMTSWASYRNNTYQGLRNRFEELEQTLQRRREQLASLRRNEAAQTLRASFLQRSEPGHEMDVLQIPEVWSIGSDTVKARARRPRRGERPLHRMPRAVMVPTDTVTWRTTLTAETLAVAQTLAAQRGWRLVTTPRQGVPDRTQEVVQMVRDFWYGMD